MPFYFQKCPKCDREFEDFRPISQYHKNPRCPKCKVVTKRTVAPIQTQLDWDKPQVSEAMACSPEDAPARERATGVKHTPTGEPIFRNKGERASFMKKTGYYDRAGYYGRG